MNNAQQRPVIYNHGYAASKVPGAYALSASHVSAIKLAMPEQAEFIDDISSVLLSSSYQIPACLLAHFSVLKYMQDSAMYAEYEKDGIMASEIKFSFVSEINISVLALYETREQQMLRAFLRFKMNDVMYTKVQKMLESKYSLTLATMDNCGCCILPVNQRELLLENQSFETNNFHRSRFGAEAVEALLIEVEEIPKLEGVQVNHTDFKSSHMLKELIGLLADVDLGKTTQLRAVK